MQIILYVVQVFVAGTMLYVWLFEFNKSTPYRGGEAQSMPEEFATYGLPAWSMYLVGFLKIGAAVGLVVGLWIHLLVLPAAGLIAALMLGALAMHLRVHDPAKKSCPALLMLVLTVGICLVSLR